MARSTDGEVERGFPRLGAVQQSITALYRGLTPGVVHGFAASVLPVDVAFGADEDLAAGVERVAGALVRHLRLPSARVAVRFRPMAEAAWVELTDGPEYVVELHPRYAEHRRDVGAVLAHEVMHVFLHRSGVGYTDTEANEILTDTAAAYLGAGWLLLDAFRQDPLTSQKLGYLTPEEYGYVLAKRAAAFGEDPRAWFTSPQAYEAYARGARRAKREAVRPPLAGGGWAVRQRYAAERTLVLRGAAPPAAGRGAGYAFESGPEPAVRFPCPTCLQRLRVPVRGRLRARCGLCGALLDCDT